MRTFAVFVAAAALVLTAKAQPQGGRQFSFEGVQLGAKLAQLPQEHRKNCEVARDKRFVFCEIQSRVGEVNLQGTLSYDNEDLAEIQVHFPAQHFDLVWSALRAKYGMEDSRSPQKLEWYSNPMRPELPIPDELLLFRTAPEQPTPDGTRFIAGTSYALIEYRSMHLARAEMKRRSQERERRVQELKGKL